MYHTSSSIPLVLSCLALGLLEVTTASSVITPRLGIPDSYVARAGQPHGLQHRDTNLTLTDNLLAVVAANASTIASRDVDASTYEDAITANSAALENLYGQSTGGISASLRASLTCDVASLIFGSNYVITPQSSNYTLEEQEPWSVNCWMPAVCFIRPQNTLEVALSLSIFTTLDTTFAVRGGGHNANPGFSSIGQQGIVLDLGALNQLTLSKDKSTVSFGPGNTWDKVYGDVAEYNLTVAGGRAAGVGVGGLLLGGGMSHFSNYWGLAADNVLNYEVVLADSSIIQVNANEYSDLFKALKGGGPNFGIVTQFTVNTFPGSELWFQVVVYDVSDVAVVMAAVVEVEEAMLQDNRIGFFLSDAPGSLTAGMVYRGSAPPSSAFQAFSNITPLVVAIPPTIGTFQSCAIALASPDGLRLQIGAVSVATDASLYVELHDIVTSLANNSAISLVYTIQPFSAQGAAHGVANGGNSLNIASENQAWLGYATSWTDASLNDEAIAVTTQLITASSNAAAAKNELLSLQFMNDASSLQDPLKSYGSASLSYLKSISKKYDPAQVFQKLQYSGFLVSKA